MKRIFTLIVVTSLLLGSSQGVTAQERGKLLIQGGVGYFSIPDFVGSIVVGFGTAFNEKGTVLESFETMLNPNLEIYFVVDDNFAIGASLSLGYASARRIATDTNVTSKSVTAIYPSLCFNAKTEYYSSGKFSIYGLLGLGATLFIANKMDEGSITRDADIALMGNFYPFGLSYGGDFGGFLEGGMGANGFLNLGVYYNF